MIRSIVSNLNLIPQYLKRVLLFDCVLINDQIDRPLFRFNFTAVQMVFIIYIYYNI
jgi:hypothetical protein